MIDPGQMRFQVSFRHYTESRSASGGLIRTWSTYMQSWAKIRTLSGYERTAAQQVGARLECEITIRYRSDYTIQTDHRIAWDSRTFEIKDVRNVDEQDIEFRMLCVEIPAQGPAASPSPSSSASGSPSASVSSSASTSVSSSVSASPSSSASASPSEGTPSASVSASPSDSVSASPSSSASSAI